MFSTQSLNRRNVRLLAGALAIFAGAPAAIAQLPSDRYITYNIRENPNDDNSSIVFKVSLKLHAEASSAGQVGWKIEEARFLKIVPSASNILWIKSSPTVNSADGRWWVSHADTQSPTIAEFVCPPALAGAALAQSGGIANLNFMLAGVHYSGPSRFNGNVAALDFQFTRVGETEPEEESDNEPTEVEDDEELPA